MAYGTSPEAPRTKPTTVNVAVILLYFVAAVSLISTILALSNYSAYKEGYAKAYEGTSQAGNEGTAAVSAVVVPAIISILLVVIFVICAILVSRGNRVGRILTWVFGGLALCCTGTGFALAGLAKSAYETSQKNDPSLPSYSQLESDINSSLPSWYSGVTLTLSILTIAAIVVAIILLALPASHPYFRKREEPQWEPPVPPSGPFNPPSGPTSPPDPNAGPA